MQISPDPALLVSLVVEQHGQILELRAVAEQLHARVQELEANRDTTTPEP